MSAEQLLEEPLLLCRKSEFQMVNLALIDEVGDDHPLTKQFMSVVHEGGWQDDEVAVITGEDRRIIRGALIMYLANPPQNCDEYWQQAMAARILGIDLGKVACAVTTNGAFIPPSLEVVYA
jgi:hypothetical protein